MPAKRADKRILVTGCGGVGGSNFVRALRAAPKRFYIAGTDYNPYHLQFPDVDARFLTPKHTDSSFIPKLREITEKYSIDFIHPDAEVEALVVAENKNSLPAKTFLPTPQAMKICGDKQSTYQKLAGSGITPKTRLLKSSQDLEPIFSELGAPLWVRLRVGAGGVGSLKCALPTEAEAWIKVWERSKGKRPDDFIVQEYLPGRDIAWDSLWKDGRLVSSSTRERLEYAFKHLTLSGIAGTPSVSRIIKSEYVNRVGEQAVRLIDPQPNGFYCLDLREDAAGKVKVTEVGAKVHTTVGLWSYAFEKALKLPWYANLPYLYTYLAFNEQPPDGTEIPKFDLYPEGYYLIRHIDCGALLWREDNYVHRIL